MCPASDELFAQAANILTPNDRGPLRQRRIFRIQPVKALRGRRSHNLASRSKDANLKNLNANLAETLWDLTNEFNTARRESRGTWQMAG